MTHQAEAIFVEAVRSSGAACAVPVWEGRRLIAPATFSTGFSRKLWVVDDPACRAFRSGKRFAVGDLDASGGSAQDAAGDPRQVERSLSALLAAFEASPAELAWGVDPSHDEKQSPPLLFAGSVVEIRVTQRCNERCPFCNTVGGGGNTAGKGQNPAAELARAVSLLDLAAEAGARSLNISGGEPLLVPWTLDLVAAARRRGFAQISIQTNALLLDDEALLDRMRKLRPTLQVSLHASNAVLSDRLTGVSGAFDRKLSGVRKALASNVPVNFNYVACRDNIDDMEAFVRLVGSLEGFKGFVGFSLVAPVGRAWRNRKRLVPTYSEAGPKILAAMRLARALGLEVAYPESCSVPLCITPGIREFASHLDRRDKTEIFPDRIKFAKCGGCPHDPVCPGVYRAYVEYHSAKEFEGT